MIKALKLRYAAILIVSTVLYVLPFHFGGFELMIFLGFMTLLLVGEFIRKIWKHDDRAMRNYVLIGVLNSVVFFQLVMIYCYLTFTSGVTLLVGVVLGALLYGYMVNRMRQVIPA